MRYTASSGPSRIGSAASIALHAVALAALAAHSPIRPPAAPSPLSVTLKRLVQSDPPRELRTEQQAAPPTQQSSARPSPRKLRAPATLPSEAQRPPAATAEIAAAPAASLSPSETVPAQPAASARTAPPPVEPPVFDAAYLRNPTPPYPALSRRMREQGRVILRVLVDATGSAAEVELRASSGSERLDASARETVRTWKFSPARRGSEPVRAWVLVPISFSLEG